MVPTDPPPGALTRAEIEEFWDSWLDINRKVEAAGDWRPMAEWYAAAMTHLVAKLTPETFPLNRFHFVNVYELYDAPRPVGAHPALALEDHFGLRRTNGSPKPAFHVLRSIIAGELALDLASVPAATPPAYWKLARWGRGLHARLAGLPASTAAAEPLVLETVVPALAHDPAHAPAGEQAARP